MILKNITRNTVITNNIKIVSSLSDRLFGLLNKKNPRSLVFKTHFGIHTFLLKEKIDVLVIEKEKVVKLKTINANSLFFYNPKFKKIIELPIGAIKKSKTQIGDLIKIEQ